MLKSHAHENSDSYNAIADYFAMHRNNAPVPNMVSLFGNYLPVRSQVLDVGCGAGVPITSFLASKDHTITGIDVSEKLLKYAQKNVPTAHFECISLLEYYTQKKFDGVVAWDVLFHLEPSEDTKAFTIISDVLEKGGYFVFSHGGNHDDESKIVGQMMGKTFYYSSPGLKQIRTYLHALQFEIIAWEEDEVEKNYVQVLAKKVK